MANGIKTFKIVINGLTESISAVDALNKQLDSLEQRINKINSIKITATVDMVTPTMIYHSSNPKIGVATK